MTEPTYAGWYCVTCDDFHPDCCTATDAPRRTVVQDVIRWWRQRRASR